MTNRELPPVIAALDVRSSDEARDLIQRLDVFDRDSVALQFRASHLMAEGNILIDEAQKEGWKVIAATRFGDEPNKLALDLDVYSKKNNNPFAITLEPPAVNRISDSASLLIAVNNVHEQGIMTIGFSHSDRLGPLDHDHIAESDLATWERARDIGIHASEVVFSGMDGFYASRKTGNDSDPLVIVSKIPAVSYVDRQRPPLESVWFNSRTAFSKGASSILLGDLVVHADNPVHTIDAILDAHESTPLN